jgi:hypothetical protein
MMTRRHAAVVFAASVTGWARARERIRFCRIPAGSLQPQVAVDELGILHLVYYAGDPRHGDLFYVKSTDGGLTFSRAIPVNDQAGSAIATGTIRGAQIAAGKGGRLHVAWNGSMDAIPAGPVNPDSGKPGMPLLYSRLDDSGKKFEAQRNLMVHSFGLDGGGSIAADRSGDVYVAWHGIGVTEASGTGKVGEARRRVWVTRSDDEGRSFSPEAKAWSQETGACGCCGMKLFAGRNGNVFALYRSATESVHRDIYFLTSKDQGKSFQGRQLDKWDINACPMSSMDLAENSEMAVGAWETGGQVFWARLDAAGGQPTSPPGEGKGRKHPRIAVNRDGEVFLAWTEGTGWQRGGSLAYQLFDRDGRPAMERGQLPGIPAWSFASATVRPDGGFSVIY